MSQGYSSENYVITQFSLDEGLPQSSVNDIIQTKDGYIWLATYGGLVRFDGLSFTTFNRSNTPGMELDRIIKLFEDSKGGVWIFTEVANSNLYRFQDGSVQKYSVNKTGSINSQMYTDKNGVLWFTTHETLYKFDGASFLEFPIIESSFDKEAISIKNGAWINLKNKIIYTSPERAIKIIDLNDLVEEGDDIITVKEFPEGSDTLILGTRSGKFFNFHEGETNKLSSEAEIEGLIFNSFGKSSINKKKLFVELFQRIGVWNGDSFDYFSPIQNEHGLSFKAVLEDTEGNVWLGTNSNGLFKLTPSLINMIDRDQGLTTESMLSLTKLSDGSALLSSNCGGVFEWRNGKAYKSNVKDYYQSGCNWAVFQDSKERIWIGGGGVYMTRSLNQRGQYFGEKEGFTNAGVYAMMEDSKGNMWFASSEGIYIYNGKDFFKKYSESDGLYYRDARALFEDNSGMVWVGSVDGLNTIKDEVVSKIALLKSNENSSSVKQPYVRAIYQDKEATMWIGTYGEGLFRIKNGIIEQITINDGLFDNVISHIVEDEYGYFWMGSNRGISRVKREGLSDYLDGKTNSLIVNSFGSSDGMNSAETNGGFQPSTFIDSTGKIYFPTVSGVAVVDPSRVSNTSVAPPVYIERLRTEEGELSKKESIIFSYDNAFLEINYTGINFTDPDGVQFKYKMIGLDNDWIEVEKLRSALYSKIPPGRYTFQVVAANSDGVWNTEGASLKITVIPPFWNTYWFYSLCILSFFLLIGFIFNRRVSKLKKENEQKKQFTEKLIESQENERRRIASELHDGLGQQILVIKNRVELAKKKVENTTELEVELDEIMESAVASINDVRAISHGLRPVHLEKFGLTEAIENLCEELQNTGEIEWSYHIDDIDYIIPKEQEINFYRVIQEAINNILKHSLASEASIIIRDKKNVLNAVIWDNGKGFNIISESKEFSKGLGFLGMSERIETLGGEIAIESQPEKETVIRIKIPIVQKKK